MIMCMRTNCVYLMLTLWITPLIHAQSNALQIGPIDAKPNAHRDEVELRGTVQCCASREIEGSIHDSVGPTSQFPFTQDTSKAEERLIKQKLAAMRQISIREANLVHRRFIERCMPHLPKDIRLQYLGSLATDNGRLKQQIEGEHLGLPISWSVERDVRVFTFWVSRKRTAQTQTDVLIEGRVIYVNVDFVDENRPVDEQLPELGGNSIRQVLQTLEK